jgi:WD40 repeat protein
MRLVLLLAAAACALPAAELTWEKDVDPIFSNHCMGCHLGNVKMGGLNLETFDGVMQGGSHGKVITPGSSQKSRLYQMIVGNLSPSMPMDGKRLSPAAIDTIKAWIDEGAKAGPEAVTEAQPKGKAAPAAKTKEPARGLDDPAIPGKTITGKKIAVNPTTEKGQIFDLAYRPDGKQVALAGFKVVQLVDPATKKVTGELTGHADTVRAVVYSPDGKMLAAAGGLPARSGEVKIWDADQKLLHTITGHGDCIYGVVFSPDGKTIATSSYDKLIKIWDVATEKEIRTLKDHIDAVYAVAFTPDGKRLISGGADRTVKVWNVATGERLYTLSEPQDGINALALDPTGKRVAAGGLDKTIRIWALGEKGGTLQNSLIAHEDAILRLAWSPDGKRLLSSSADRTVKLFNADDLTELNSFPESDWVYGLEWSPDSKTFAVGRFDGTWEFAPALSKTVASSQR